MRLLNEYVHINIVILLSLLLLLAVLFPNMCTSVAVDLLVVAVGACVDWVAYGAGLVICLVL